MESTTQFFNTTFITDGLLSQTEALATKSPAGVSEGCFIDPQLAFILLASSGSLMFILIISVLVLTCKVITLKRQCRARRPIHSNVDLRGSGHWSTERAEEGIVGPCETNLLLEEVQIDTDDAVGQEEEEEDEVMLHQRNTKKKDEENVLATMQSSTSRDSCIDPAKELEDMPLVV